MENKHPSMWTELPEGVFCKCTDDGDFSRERGADCGLADKIAGRSLEMCPKCGRFPWAYKAPIASDSFHKATVDEKLSTKDQIIPLREKVYGRDTHAALMAAHRKREQAAQWTEGRTRKLLSDSGTGDTISCLMRSIGDKLTYDGRRKLNER